MPTDHTAVRRAIDIWMDDNDIFPDIVAEFEDSALLKVFGQAGEGIFPVPTAIEKAYQTLAAQMVEKLFLPKPTT